MLALAIPLVIPFAPGELIAGAGVASALVPTRSLERSPENPRSSSGRDEDVRRPGIVQLSAPFGVIEDPEPTFAWQAVPGAEEYYLEIRGKRLEFLFRNWFPSETICGQDGMCRVEPALSELTLPDGRYDWWVRAASLTGSGPRSHAVRLRVRSSPAP
jgi:hypothetical protein